MGQQGKNVIIKFDTFDALGSHIDGIGIRYYGRRPCAVMMPNFRNVQNPSITFMALTVDAANQAIEELKKEILIKYFYS